MHLRVKVRDALQLGAWRVRFGPCLASHLDRHIQCLRKRCSSLVEPLFCLGQAFSNEIEILLRSLDAGARLLLEAMEHANPVSNPYRDHDAIRIPAVIIKWLQDTAATEVLALLGMSPICSNHRLKPKSSCTGRKLHVVVTRSTDPLGRLNGGAPQGASRAAPLPSATDEGSAR